MKLRMQDDSVRLRMRRSEVLRLAAEGRVAARVHFGARILEYSIELDDDFSQVIAEFAGDAIRVRVPRAQGLEWCRTTAVGLPANSGIPAVLVEKDFVRTAVAESDDYDRYENPRSGRKPPPPPG
ncbi:MAG: hypothetical protein NTY38_09975 [Acidobacteria bacterium]|nr:hypothetical protein [Acidobacteriota bacterium]